jgi:hypothetical protein
MKSRPRILASVALALAGITLNAQTHPSRMPTVHPIPSAPTKVFVPASFSALPELQCKLYPGGSDASRGLSVFTDDDGYARFHAVRATASDAVQRLALDCTNSAGKSYSYSVDLTADETFAPRALNLANERGTDRPALKGDPLSYSQEELIQAGYAPRPDPTDTGAYARWLEAATAPGRMLEARRPAPAAHTNLVTKTTANPWTGSVMTGAPNYVSTEVNYTVPTAIPDGDETSAGTEEALWNGLGGYGTGSGLIQSGVGIQTSGLTAVYYTWREYCCGDGDSNGYKGNFIPNPGDKIYSVNWYCNAKGGISLNGGYGCSHIHDLTSGAILDCTAPQPTTAACWSVKATAGMTLGKAAEFVIENQTPQCCGSATAFTDFTPQVNMVGSARSSTTGTYSQTISTDPVVDELEDFTNTTSHINVSLGTTNETYFSTSQFKRVGGLASFAAPAESIGVGPNANGSTVGDAWVLGSVADSSGDYAIFQWKSSKWVQQSGRANRIAVGPEGYPWVVNSVGNIYYWNGTAFEPAPGGACASWIGVGYNNHGSTYGGPWILGCHEGSGGYSIYQLQGSTWVLQPGSAVKLTMGPRGPWVISTKGTLYYWNGTTFLAGPTACATSIGVGSLTAPFAGPWGDVWITGCTLDGNGYHIYQLQNGITWVEIPGTASQISVSPDLGIPWVVNSLGQIFE